MSFGYQVLGFGSGGKGPIMVCTGGTITDIGSHKVHTFTSSGTFTVSSIPTGAPSFFGISLYNRK